MDHVTWLNKCVESYSERRGLSGDISEQHIPVPSSPQRSLGVTTPVSSKTSIEEPAFGDQADMTIQEFIEHMREMGKNGIKEEYNYLRMQPVAGKFETTRYSNLHTRNNIFARQNL